MLGVPHYYTDLETITIRLLTPQLFSLTLEFQGFPSQEFSTNPLI
jgi:hypothetical protein